MSKDDEYIAELEAKVECLTADNANSKREAESLAMSLWRRHYQDVSPDFELCDTTAGVITQIDNMVAGVVQNNEKLLSFQCEVITSLQAKVKELTAAEDVAIWGEYTQGTITDLQAKVDEQEKEIEKQAAVIALMNKHPALKESE